MMERRHILVKLISFICLAAIGIIARFDVTFAGDNAAQASRISVQADLLNLSARAQQYYWRPSSKGGGGNSFNGLTADSWGLAKLLINGTTPHGTFSILTAGSGTSVELKGLGAEKGSDWNPIQVKILVFADSVAVTFVN